MWMMLTSGKRKAGCKWQFNGSLFKIIPLLNHRMGQWGLVCIPPNNFGSIYLKSRNILVSFVEQTEFNFGSILFFFFFFPPIRALIPDHPAPAQKRNCLCLCHLGLFRTLHLEDGRQGILRHFSIVDGVFTHWTLPWAYLDCGTMNILFKPYCKHVSF